MNKYRSPSLVMRSAANYFQKKVPSPVDKLFGESLTLEGGVPQEDADPGDRLRIKRKRERENCSNFKSHT